MDKQYYKVNGGWNEKYLKECVKHSMTLNAKILYIFMILIFVFYTILTIKTKMYKNTAYPLMMVIGLIIWKPLAERNLVKANLKRMKELGQEESFYDIIFYDNYIEIDQKFKVENIKLYYSDINRIMETSNVLTLFTNAGISYSIFKSSFERDEKYAFFDFMLEKQPKLKLKKYLKKGDI